MNKICEICDTRCRLCMCKGRDGDFKYCFRRVGSTNGLEETITPFNTLHELYEKCEWLHDAISESLFLDKEPYGAYGVGDNMCLLCGKYIGEEGFCHPIGFVSTIKENMKTINWEDEL